MLLNEYRLNPARREDQEVIVKQLEMFFFGEGSAKPKEYVRTQRVGNRASPARAAATPACSVHCSHIVREHHHKLAAATRRGTGKRAAAQDLHRRVIREGQVVSAVRSASP